MAAIQKSIEISDAKIQFVSLVNKAANKRQFLITKADEGHAQFSTTGKILKVDDETHYVTGIVYEPLKKDAHDNFMTEAEIRKAAHWFAKNGDKVDIQHSFEQVEGVTVVETYVAPCDMEIEGTPVIKGTWLMTAEIQNGDVWEKIKKEEITGYSMGGIGKYAETETDIDPPANASAERQGLFKKLAGLFGFDIVEKDEFRDAYDENTKASGFWDAFYALQDTLSSYDWETNETTFEMDETKIREALSEFYVIISDVLAGASITKSLATARPITKEDKKISGKNREILKSIRDNLTALLSEFDTGNEKEEIEVTNSDVQKIVDTAIAKAMTGEPKEAEKDGAEVTAESVQKMVDEAVIKALAPAEEPITSGNIRQMVEDAVAKAVEPVLKARGFASNLNKESVVAKADDRHYLTGII